MKKLFVLTLLIASAAVSAEDFVDINKFRACKSDHANILQIGQSIDQREDQLRSEIRSHQMRITSLNTFRIRIQNPNLFYNSNEQYQADLNSFNRAADEINTNAKRLEKSGASIDEAINRYNSKIDDFENECSNMNVSTKDFNEVCGNSNSAFCRSFEAN